MANRSLLSPVQTTIRLLIGVVGLIFVAGMAAGFVDAMSDSNGQFLAPKPLAVLTFCALLAVTMTYLIIDTVRRRQAADGPIAPRERRSRLLLSLSLLLGAVIGGFGAAFGLFDSLRDPVAHPLNPVLGIVILAIMIVILPSLSWLWHRSIDEHERESYRDGAVVASYYYLLIVPIWWVGARLAVLPPVDGTFIFFGFSLVLTAAWFWRRFR